jgi:ketosteroid isomerase-like protein
MAEEVMEPTAKTLVWPDGTRYVGGVENGKRTGKGTIFWQDGTRFVGQFVNDMRNGPGTMILPDGTVYTGFFKDDELVDSPVDGNRVASQSKSSQSEGAQSAALNLNTQKSITKTETTAAIALIPPTIVAKNSAANISAANNSAANSNVAKKSPAIEEVTKPAAIVPIPITTLTDDSRQQLKETIDLWAAAWSDKNVPQYLSNYSDDFIVPGKLSRNSWEGLRRTRLKRPKYIRVTIDYERVEIVAPDIADVYFKQTYRSNTYSDVTNKVIHLRKEDHTWMILSEKSR